MRLDSAAVCRVLSDAMLMVQMLLGNLDYAGFQVLGFRPTHAGLNEEAIMTQLRLCCLCHHGSLSRSPAGSVPKLSLNAKLASAPGPFKPCAILVWGLFQGVVTCT